MPSAAIQPMANSSTPCHRCFCGPRVSRVPPPLVR